MQTPCRPSPANSRRPCAPRPARAPSARSGCRRRKQVERVHEGRADDAEDVLHALGDQGFHKRFAGVMCLLLMSISWRAGAGRVDSGLHIGRAPILHPKRRHSHPASFHFPQNPSRGGPPQARSSFLKDERRILRRAALTLLELVAQSERPVSLAALTEASGLPAVRAAHPVAAGRRRHAAASPPARATSAAGARDAMINSRCGERHRILDSLVDEIGETCNCTMLDGDEVVYLDRVETAWPLRVNLQPGSRVPLHCSASGKLFLAHMRREARERLLPPRCRAIHPVRHAGAGPRIPQHPQGRRQLRPRGIPAGHRLHVPILHGNRAVAAVALHAPLARCPSTRPAPGCRACSRRRRRVRGGCADAGRLNAPLSRTRPCQKPICPG